MHLNWHNNTPISTLFDDVYYSMDDPLAESTSVFLAGNTLPERLHKSKAVHVVETGFGTGLNFLLTWTACHGTTALRYTSVELYPLTPADMRRALAVWPSLTPFAEQLLSAWKNIDFNQPCVTANLPGCILTLYFGDAGQCYSKTDFTADAWYLDGFAPKKNPGMWTPQLFAAMARQSRTGTTFSTFTAAAVVREGLRDSGFVVERVPGFGRKRHRLQGYWP